MMITRPQVREQAPAQLSPVVGAVYDADSCEGSVAVQHSSGFPNRAVEKSARAFFRALPRDALIPR
jgi:hypothetical protein